jgi:hypothetical protein
MFCQLQRIWHLLVWHDVVLDLVNAHENNDIERLGDYFLVSNRPVGKGGENSPYVTISSKLKSKGFGGFFGGPACATGAGP